GLRIERPARGPGMSDTASQLAPQPMAVALPKDRTPLAHLLHALNQPLTGLQCSLELATAGARRPEQYLQTIHEGLELTLRMRILVTALRELADLEQQEAHESEALLLVDLLRQTTSDLLPVAETRGIHVQIAGDHPLQVRPACRLSEPM